MKAVEALKIAAKNATSVNFESDIDLSVFDIWHRRIAYYASLSTEQLGDLYSNVARATGVDFKIPSRELFVSAKFVFEDFVTGHVPPRQLAWLKTLVKSEVSKIKEVAVAFGKMSFDPDPGSLSMSLLMMSTTYPAAFLDKIEPSLDMTGRVGETYPADFRLVLSHKMEMYNDRSVKSSLRR